VATAYQSSAPNSGPTLAIAIARRWSAHHAEFAARIVVDDRRGNG
jgi:hypothetical protein